jgi:hypothetical protein
LCPCFGHEVSSVVGHVQGVKLRRKGGWGDRMYSQAMPNSREQAQAPTPSEPNSRLAGKILALRAVTRSQFPFGEVSAISHRLRKKSQRFEGAWYGVDGGQYFRQGLSSLGSMVSLMLVILWDVKDRSGGGSRGHSPPTKVLSGRSRPPYD